MIKAEALVMQLMAIPGGSGDESRVADFIREQLLKAGAPAKSISQDAAYRRSPHGGDTGNLVFKLPGSGPDRRAPRRLLMAHMDTVPICVGCKPVKKGKWVSSADPTTGLGADDRAGCAVTLHTALRILREDVPHPPLTFLWTVQEEVGLHGARHLGLGKLGKPKLAFNWDGGAPEKLTVGATGGFRMSIRIRGLASHAGNAPAAGVSAIAIASLAIADLHRRGWHGAVKKGSKEGTSNVGVIKGGDATNVVTDDLLVRVEARSHDPKFREAIVREIHRAFRSAVNEVRSEDGKKGSLEIESRLDYESFRLPRNDPSVRAASAALCAEKLQPLLYVTNGGLDANWMFAHGIPTVTMGCGQKFLHTVREQLDLPQFQTACKIAWRLAVTEN